MSLDPILPRQVGRPDFEGGLDLAERPHHLLLISSYHPNYIYT
jgi:hypothetical protein